MSRDDYLEESRGSQIFRKGQQPAPTPMVMCGCGHHKIDPGLDPYAQHNAWMQGQGLYGATHHFEDPVSKVSEIRGRSGYVYQLRDNQVELENDW
jgi:hypothetical protein